MSWSPSMYPFNPVVQYRFEQREQYNKVCLATNAILIFLSQAPQQVHPGLSTF